MPIMPILNLTQQCHPAHKCLPTTSFPSSPLPPRASTERSRRSPPLPEMDPPSPLTTASSAPALGASATPLDSLRSIGSAALATALTSLSTPSASDAADLKSHATSLWSSARPWADFFSSKKFVQPTGLDDLRARLVDNLAHFAANYVIIFCALSALGVIVHPLSVVCVGLCLGAYVFLFLHNPGSVRLGPVVLDARMKKAVFGVIAALFLWATAALSILGTWAFFSAGISVVHAGARVSVKEPDFESEV